MLLSALSIRGRLYLVGMCAIAAFAVMAGVGMIVGQKVRGAMAEAVELRASIEAVSEMRLANIELVLAAMDSIIDKAEGEIQPERAETISRSIAAVREGTKVALALARLVGEGPLMATFVADFDAVAGAIQVDLARMVEAGASADEFAKLDDVIDGGGARVTETLATLAHIGGAALAARLASAEQAGVWSQILQVAAALTALIVVGAIVFLVGRSVDSQLTRLAGSMNLLAEGRLDLEIKDAGRTDEVGVMARAIEVFRRNAVERQALMNESEETQRARARRQERMDALIGEFRKTAQGTLSAVAVSAEQMKATAETMAETAKSSASKAATAAAASDDTSSNVQTVATAAEELASSISEIARQVTQTTEVVEKASHNANSTNERVAGLAAAAQKIGDVVSLIQDIAAQTNLLALNATIEAARAGEMGKGFAVVASEVKMLANQTAQATEEISQQISAIQGSTGAVVEAIREITAVMSDANAYVTAIATAVEQQGAATAEISENVTHAAAGSRHVAINMSEVTNAIGETSSSAGEVLECSGRMAFEAEALREQVDHFLSEVAAA